MIKASTWMVPVRARMRVKLLSSANSGSMLTAVEGDQLLRKSKQARRVQKAAKCTMGSGAIITSKKSHYETGSDSSLAHTDSLLATMEAGSDACSILPIPPHPGSETPEKSEACSFLFCLQEATTRLITSQLCTRNKHSLSWSMI